MIFASLLVLSSLPVMLAAGDGEVFVIIGRNADIVVLKCLVKETAAGNTRLVFESDDGRSISFSLIGKEGRVFPRRSAACYVAAQMALAHVAELSLLAEKLNKESTSCCCLYCACTARGNHPCTCDAERCKKRGCLCGRWPRETAPAPRPKP